jgi:hypothetical protein
MFILREAEKYNKNEMGGQGTRAKCYMKPQNSQYTGRSLDGLWTHKESVQMRGQRKVYMMLSAQGTAAHDTDLE